MPPESADELRKQLADQRHLAVMNLLTEVRDLARATNGRVTALETKVAIIEAVGVAGGGSGPSKKAITGYATAAGTAVVGLVEIIKAVVGALKG